MFNPETTSSSWSINLFCDLRQFCALSTLLIVLIKGSDLSNSKILFSCCFCPPVFIIFNANFEFVTETSNILRVYISYIFCYSLSFCYSLLVCDWDIECTIRRVWCVKREHWTEEIYHRLLGNWRNVAKVITNIPFSSQFPNKCEGGFSTVIFYNYAAVLSIVCCM